ncbi:MAG: hypothetical protein FJW95_15465 [Actinobacteria bacterium]|nr:hypothetical protein [Actinomycetota bacterium]
MTDATTPEPQLNRAGRRAETRRLRKTGAVIAAIPAAFGTTALLLGATTLPAGAATLTVTNLNKDGAGSLHDLAESAADGDTIVFQAGLTGTITLDDEINIDTSVTINGPGADVITVSGGDTDRIFEIDGPSNATRLDVVISGLTLTKGAGGFGGAILFDDTNLTVRDSILTDNNSVGSGGGAIATEDQDQDLVIDNTEISGNTANGSGGGVYFYSADGGTFTMTNSIVQGNTATGDGGGLWIKGEDSNETGAVTITGSTISGNTTKYEGGGLFAYYIGSLDISATTISGNTSQTDGGGGLAISYVVGAVNITGSTITGNSADGYGGGVYLSGIEGPAATITFTTIAGNTASGGGGGIEYYNSEGSLIIRNSALSGNMSEGYGGAIYVDDGAGPVEIYNSTISGNTAAEEGGAISFAGYYGLKIVQSTIANNRATTVGGIWIHDARDSAVSARDAEKDAKTAAKNEARIAAGKEPLAPRVQEDRVRPLAMAPVVANGSIITLNSGADIGKIGVLEATSSLLGTISGTTLTDKGGNLQGVDPKLGPLQDNGGPTQTHALLDGSPAINAGPDPLTPFPGSADDQRGPGYPRVVGGRVDIGAFEVQPTPIEPTFTG